MIHWWWSWSARGRRGTSQVFSLCPTTSKPFLSGVALHNKSHWLGAWNQGAILKTESNMQRLMLLVERGWFELWGNLWIIHYYNHSCWWDTTNKSFLMPNRPFSKTLGELTITQCLHLTKHKVIYHYLQTITSWPLSHHGCSVVLGTTSDSSGLMASLNPTTIAELMSPDTCQTTLSVSTWRTRTSFTEHPDSTEGPAGSI